MLKVITDENGKVIVGNNEAYTMDISAPTGTISITQNGTHDVTNYASADVNVSAGSDFFDVPTTLDNSKWITGYIQGINDGLEMYANSSAEMVNTSCIKVEGGKTYEFLNSNSAWGNGGWTAFVWLRKRNSSSVNINDCTEVANLRLSSFPIYAISRATYPTVATVIRMTAPSDAEYVRITSSNMANYYTTAIFREVT